MPTPAERKALAFLAGVALLGAGSRVSRAVAEDRPAAGAQPGLRAHLAAIDAARNTPRKGKPRRPAAGRKVAEPIGTIDVDVASADELTRLPRIGPVLAARIVAEREANGTFGSLEGLQRVKGVGPAMSKQLAPHVTFSGTVRPSRESPQAGSGGAQRAREPPGRRVR